MSLTFDLSPEQVARQARARDVASLVLAPAAATIDATGEVPAAVLEAITALRIWDGTDRVAAVLMIEELARGSASAAARATLDPAAGPSVLAGLRGVPRVNAPEDRHHLALAAVCLGIGRAALGQAIDTAKARGDRPAGDPADPPHWALADAATEIDAARLLLHATAAGRGLSAPAALIHAATAVGRAVDASLRIVGGDGYRPGSVLERCARDARAAWLVLGTEDHARRVAADALLGT
jgi:alkylation response protein AidB-like acyl-CoA dehydrogenase